MHKRSSLLAVLLASSTFSGANAADLPVELPVPPLLVNWTGFYAGIAAGGGAINYDSDFGGGLLNIDGFSGDGFLAQGTVGYDRQFGNLVFGLLGDIHISNMESEATLLGLVNASLESKWGFDALARGGVLLNDRTLLYALGGWSWERFEGNLSIPLGGIDLDEDENADGWTVGAGLEVLVTNNVSVKGEYRFTNFDDIDFDTGGVVSLEPNRHVATLGVNYKFGGPAGDGARAQYDGEALPVLANWTGIYAGIAAGGGIVNYDTEVLGGVLGIDGFGGQGGLVEGTVGADYQMNTFVLGVLGNVHWSNLEAEASTPVAGGISAELETQWGFDALVRGGVLVTDRTLLYALGGWSWQEFEGKASFGGGSVSDDETSDGFTIGAGIEALVTDNISIKGEYRFTGLDDFDFGTGGILTLEPDRQTARVGVNYKLHGGPRQQ